MRRVRFKGAAIRELNKAVDRYDSQRHGLGDEFAEEVERAAQLVKRLPTMGAPHLAGTRRIQLGRFPYQLVYLDLADELVVIAVAHHRRRPDYWLRRI